MKTIVMLKFTHMIAQAYTILVNFVTKVEKHLKTW